MTTRQDLLDSLEATFTECLETCRIKNSDYAQTDEAWGNLALVEHLFPGVISKEQGVLIRMSDKLQRLANATVRDLKVKDESFIDTCDDMIVYAGILKAMHEEHTFVKLGPPLRRLLRGRCDNLVQPGHGPLRIYIAGPFTGDGSDEDKMVNREKAHQMQRALTEMGHFPHCPHTHTYELDGIFDNSPIDEYAYFMDLDLRYIEQMMDALIRLPGDSPGADKEVKLAKALGLPVYTCLEDVPRPTEKDTPNVECHDDTCRPCSGGTEEDGEPVGPLHHNEPAVLEPS